MNMLFKKQYDDLVTAPTKAFVTAALEPKKIIIGGIEIKLFPRLVLGADGWKVSDYYC